MPAGMYARRRTISDEATKIPSVSRRWVWKSREVKRHYQGRHQSRSRQSMMARPQSGNGVTASIVMPAPETSIS